MKRIFGLSSVGLLLFALTNSRVDGRGFGGGGFGGSFSSRSFSAAGGFSSFGGERSFSGERSFGSYGTADRSFGSYSGSRSGESYSGWDRSAGSSSYDRSYTGDRGGSISTEGTRDYAAGPRGAAAGGTRDTTITTPGGRTYSGSTDRSAAVGPYGRSVGGATHTGDFSGPRGTATNDWQRAFSSGPFATDFGLSHYTSINAGGVHSTAYWSNGAVATRAGAVRANFGYYNAFRPGWYAAHPGCWYAAGWATGAAWRAAAWAPLASFCGVAAEPVDYDFGDTVVYQNNTVYTNGTETASAADYAQQAINLADQGQTAQAPPEQEWQPLGVFALVPGDEKTSNNIFQLAVNKAGVIRGNYYDGVMDTTTPVFGSVDKTTQRAAWTIGKKADRVFDAGLFNLTKNETPVLVHFGKDRTQQWLLVRVEQPAQPKSAQP